MLKHGKWLNKKAQEPRKMAQNRVNCFLMDNKMVNKMPFEPNLLTAAFSLFAVLRFKTVLFRLKGLLTRPKQH